MTKKGRQNSNSWISWQLDKERRQNFKTLLIKENGSKCGYCFKEKRFSQLSIDHIVPTSKGGPDKKWNMLLACKKCNNKKADMDIDDWLKYIGWES